MRILIVDDEPGLREVVSRHLRDAGFEVAAAEDGARGLEMAMAETPDLVLTDLNMPRLRLPIDG